MQNRAQMKESKCAKVYRSAQMKSADKVRAFEPFLKKFPKTNKLAFRQFLLVGLLDNTVHAKGGFYSTFTIAIVTKLAT